jgi:hypothetical protein
VIDYQKINQVLLPNLLSHARSWVPNGKVIGNSYFARNPRRHDRKIGSFSLRLIDGVWCDFATGEHGGDLISFYAYINGISQFEAAQTLSSSMDGALPCKIKYHPPKVPKSPNIDSVTRAQKIWNNSKPIIGTLAEKYLITRGVKLPCTNALRFSSSLWHSPSQQFLPCMVAAINSWPSEKIIGIHRTFLTEDGKRKCQVKPNKMMLGQVQGGSVQLSTATNTLILAEGIETAMSVLVANPEIGVWAVLSAVGFKNVVLPKSVQNILIAADNDRTGKKFARDAATQWVKQGKSVKIALPPIGKDLNDLLLER